MCSKLRLLVSVVLPEVWARERSNKVTQWHKANQNEWIVISFTMIFKQLDKPSFIDINHRDMIVRTFDTETRAILSQIIKKLSVIIFLLNSAFQAACNTLWPISLNWMAYIFFAIWSYRCNFQKPWFMLCSSFKISLWFLNALEISTVLSFFSKFFAWKQAKHSNSEKHYRF